MNPSISVISVSHKTKDLSDIKRYQEINEIWRFIEVSRNYFEYYKLFWMRLTPRLSAFKSDYLTVYESITHPLTRRLFLPAENSHRTLDWIICNIFSNWRFIRRKYTNLVSQFPRVNPKMSTFEHEISSPCFHNLPWVHNHNKPEMKQQKIFSSYFLPSVFFSILYRDSIKSNILLTYFRFNAWMHMKQCSIFVYNYCYIRLS